MELYLCACQTKCIRFIFNMCAVLIWRCFFFMGYFMSTFYLPVFHGLNITSTYVVRQKTWYHSMKFTIAIFKCKLSALSSNMKNFLLAQVNWIKPFQYSKVACNFWLEDEKWTVEELQVILTMVLAAIIRLIMIARLTGYRPNINCVQTKASPII